MIYWIALHLPQKIRLAVAEQFVEAAIVFNGPDTTLGQMLAKFADKEKKD